MLKQKSDALHAFKILKSYGTTQFNAQIKVIQSYFGDEFRPLTKLLNELGIKH